LGSVSTGIVRVLRPTGQALQKKQTRQNNNTTLIQSKIPIDFVKLCQQRAKY
jgi:hypothetical protein